MLKIMPKKKIGKLTIPPDTFPEKHELVVANIFIKSGSDVAFLKPRTGYKAKTPDIRMNGLDWEIKSPTGKSRNTISNQMHRASQQASNLILDTSRTKLAEDLINKQLRKSLADHRSIKHLIVITKTGRIIDIK
jgi:hypothetical protein